LSRLRGGAVEERNGRRVGPLRDIVVADDRRVIAAIVDEKRIPLEAGLRVAPKRRSAA
jgi:sporulation protein YlmC with PRC-barrel domain